MPGTARSMTCVSQVHGSGFVPIVPDGPSFFIEVEDDVVRRVHIPEVPLAVEAKGMSPFEHARPLAPRARKAAVGLELEHRVVAAIECHDVAVRSYRHAAQATDDGIGGIVKEVFDQMERQGRDRRSSRAILRVHRVDGAQRHRHHGDG